MVIKLLLLYSSFSSPDSETIANSLVLVGHGIHGDLDRLKEMNISELFRSVFTVCLREYASLLMVFLPFDFHFRPHTPVVSTRNSPQRSDSRHCGL